MATATLYDLTDQMLQVECVLSMFEGDDQDEEVKFAELGERGEHVRIR